jgi:hypothetical protein
MLLTHCSREARRSPLGKRCKLMRLPEMCVCVCESEREREGEGEREIERGERPEPRTSPLGSRDK